VKTRKKEKKGQVSKTILLFGDNTTFESSIVFEKVVLSPKSSIVFEKSRKKK